MQTRLLSLLAQLDQPTTVSGLWLVHSDEPLAIQWLIDACRPHWANHHQLIKRTELVSAKSWTEVVNDLDSPDLFGDSTALIVTGKHKIDTKDKALTARLERFAQDVKDNNSQNHLIWCLPKQDKKSLATKAVQFFDTHGLIIDANLYDEKLRGDLLAFKAKKLGLTLDHTAWQMLMSHTEHNLLTAYQTLWRLSFLPHTDMVSMDELEQALVAGSAFNVFDLSDALLHANPSKTLSVLNHLKNTDTAPSLVLWAVAKDARLILQIQAGKNPYELGIWQNKVHLYTNIAQRTQATSSDWLTQIYTIDKAIKGVSDKDAWSAIQTLCLAICGVHFEC